MHIDLAALFPIIFRKPEVGGRGEVVLQRSFVPSVNMSRAFPRCQVLCWALGLDLVPVLTELRGMAAHHLAPSAFPSTVVRAVMGTHRGPWEWGGEGKAILTI